MIDSWGYYLDTWRQFMKMEKAMENLSPQTYGELLQKKRRRGKRQSKKRRGRK